MSFKIKVFTKCLFYLPLVFIIFYLYLNNLLVIPDNVKQSYFFSSLLLVLIGFGAAARAWQIIVQTEITDVTYKDAFISKGLYIFTKYIPGKLWVIVGQAGYIKEKYQGSLFTLTSFSLFYQMMALFTATITGIAVIYHIDNTWFWFSVLGAVLFIIFVTFFYKPSVSLISKVISFIVKKDVLLPAVSKRIVVKVFFYSALNWVFWSFAFYLMLLSVLPHEIVVMSSGFLFPVSSVVGIIVVFAPGGLGVREGFIVLGLMYYGIALSEASAVAVLSRLWFIIGEFLFFISAFILSHTNRTNLKKFKHMVERN